MPYSTESQAPPSSHYNGSPPPVLIIHDPGPAHPSFSEQEQHPSSLTVSSSPPSALPGKVGLGTAALDNGVPGSRFYPTTLEEFKRLDTREINEHRVAGELLDTVFGWSFWRFDMELRLGAHQRLVKYSIGVSGGPSACVSGEGKSGGGHNFKIEEVTDAENEN